MAVDPRLLEIGIQEAPALINLIKSAFVRAHPDQPQPTSADVLALFEANFATSLATDDRILADG